MRRSQTVSTMHRWQQLFRSMDICIITSSKVWSNASLFHPSRSSLDALMMSQNADVLHMQSDICVFLCTCLSICWQKGLIYTISACIMLFTPETIPKLALLLKVIPEDSKILMWGEPYEKDFLHRMGISPSRVCTTAHASTNVRPGLLP